jgi:hypothetical protein
VRLQFLVRTAHPPWSDDGGIPDSSLPTGDRLEVWEVILAKELEHGLHPTNGKDLSTKLDKAHARVDRIDSERATEAEQLS